MYAGDLLNELPHLAVGIEFVSEAYKSSSSSVSLAQWTVRVFFFVCIFKQQGLL
jgi:hypothetical protein